MSSEGSEFDVEKAIKEITYPERISIVALSKLMDERSMMEAEQEKLRQTVKNKYYQHIKPLLSRASQIIRGASLQPEQVEGIDQLMKTGEKIQDHMKGKVINGYWNGVLSNSALVDEITESDEQALQFLLDIEHLESQPTDNQSIELKFVFKSNPFFNENELRRKLVCKNCEILCLQGDRLTWKQGKCLTHKLRKVQEKHTGEKKVILGTKTKSFFDIFLDWDLKNQEKLSWAAGTMTELANLVLSNHIDYFLGIQNADEESEEEEEEQEEDENRNDQ